MFSVRRKERQLRSSNSFAVPEGSTVEAAGGSHSPLVVAGLDHARISIAAKRSCKIRSRARRPGSKPVILCSMSGGTHNLSIRMRSPEMLLALRSNPSVANPFERRYSVVSKACWCPSSRCSGVLLKPKSISPMRSRLEPTVRRPIQLGSSLKASSKQSFSP